ncbi:MAG: NAD-dependent deacylase [Saprospiraceae bacterium]|nr:NAD-dependent deacylase [Bacteroidia bacterium]NNL91573.1 NAD-dependent deacylase [Saprospiraceae bacterium]
MKKIVTVLSGAGVSAESGIKTFRDADGLWEGHDVMTVASPQGWEDDMELVLDFYNQRRRQLKEVQPNAAHLLLSKLESHYSVNIITQNVDDLHERGGSTNVLHLHGELLKVRSTADPRLIYHWEKDLIKGDKCTKGSQLRPHIVWFGEEVPLLEKAAEIVNSSDIIIIIGTSMQVYPAASLVSYSRNADIFYIDPNPKTSYELNHIDYTLIKEPATIGMESLYNQLVMNEENN